MFDHPDIHHVWINTMCVTGAFLVYNALAIVRRHLGEGGLLRLFRSPPPRSAGENKTMNPT